MRHWLFRRVLVVITLGAFLSAGVAQAAWPVRDAASHGMTMMAQADGSEPMPCTGMTPACMSDLGCIFIIGLPTVSSPETMTHLSWSRVNYRDLSRITGGLTHKPALDPPIFPR